MGQQIIYDGKDYTAFVEFIRHEDTPQVMAGILEDMVYTFAVERLTTQIIGPDDAYSVTFMRHLIEAMRSIKPVKE